MHYQIILTILAPALLAGVQAECYKSGRAWDNTAPANDVVQDICNSNGVSGQFVFKETKTHCQQRDDGSHYIFTVGYLGDGSGVTLDDAACREGLRNEVNACAQGGETTSGDWFFK
jgi:hypothetical protein